MKQRIFAYCLLLVIIFGTITLLQNCSVEIESKCSLDKFEGKYVGKYDVGNFLVVPQADTIIVEVDSTNNTAKITSVSLDTFFVTKYLETKNRLNIDPLSIPYFSFTTATDTIELTGVFIGGGFITLVDGCDQLYIQMNNLDIEDNNADLPKDLKGLELTSPNFMRRL